MNKKILNYILILLSVVLLGISIYYFATSFSFYQDEYGTDISFDNDQMVLMLSAVVLLIFSIYKLVADNKNTFNKDSVYISFGIISIVNSLYDFGAFFKAIAKEKPVLENLDYCFSGIVFGVLFAYILVSYLLESKKNKTI